MTQVVPQFQINQIFTSVTEATTRVLRALAMGPVYRARRDQALGVYDGGAAEFVWPSTEAGSQLDLPFTRVTFQQAATRFGIVASGAGVQTTTDNNVIKGVNWQLNEQPGTPSSPWARDAALPYDLAVGDWIRVGDGSETFQTTVTGFSGDTVAASTGSATDQLVFPTQAGASVIANTGTSEAVADDTGLDNPLNYSGEAIRQLTETYTLTVLEVGAQGTGNAGDWTTVRLQVTSASGTDVDEIIIPAPGVTFDVGTRGARLTLNHGAANDDFVVGDTWTLTITQDYTEPVVASAGTYLGDTDTTYVVTVTKGGPIDVGASAAERAQISVTTSDASDTGAPAAVTTAVALAIGTKGVTATLTGDVLVQGDSWTIAATSAKTGPVNELRLANSLPAALQGVSLQVEVARLVTAEVPANRLQAPPLTNWTASQSSLALDLGIQMTNPALDGSTYYDVVDAQVVATYRDLDVAAAGTVVDIDSEADAQAFAGADDIDNVMGYALRRALENAGGQTVKAIAVASDDLAGYAAAVTALEEREDFHRIVPLTYDEDVQDAVISEVNRRSTATNGRWATTMIALPLNTETQLVGVATDSAQSFATITDPASGSNYVRLTDENGEFITKGVKVGDIVRYAYTTDGFDGMTYSSAAVAEVLAEDMLTLATAAGAPVLTPSVYEIWRDLTVAEQAADWAQRSGSFSNRRVTVAFPPAPRRNGETGTGYFLAASLAALRGASAPHQGLTNAEVIGWDDLSQAAVTFADQLDTLANGGAYIVTQAPAGAVYIRKQLTTDLSDTKTAEDSATVNTDSISYYFKDLLSPFIGRANVVPSALSLIEAAIANGISFLKTDTFTDELGGQLTDADLAYLRPHAVLADRVVARIDADLPIPLNNGELDLVV